MTMSRTKIRRSLIKQLEIKGTKTEYLEDQVDDYLAFWDIKEALQSDVRNRGVTYKDFSSVGVEMMKNNPSTKELAMINKQMMSLLKDMGLNEPVPEKADDSGGSDLI